MSIPTRTNKMKALIYKRFGGPDVLEWVDNWPDPIVGAGEVLISTRAGGLNPKDALLRKGMFSKTYARDPLPRVSGLDAAGAIIAIGDAVSGFSVGDVVFGMTNHFSGGVHAEVARFDADEIALAPTSIALTAASSVPLAAMTALQAIRDCCRIDVGQRVLINGASGGVGHFAVQIAKALGAEVHAVCSARNLDFVASLGADRVHDYGATPATEIDAACDAVFDVFGKLTRRDFTKQLGRSGIYVSTVPKSSTIIAEFLGRIGLKKNARLVQVRSNSADLRQLQQWIDGGLVKPHVEKIYPIEQAADAHRHIESKRTVGKIVLSFAE